MKKIIGVVPVIFLFLYELDVPLYQVRLTRFGDKS